MLYLENEENVLRAKPYPEEALHDKAANSLKRNKPRLKDFLVPWKQLRREAFPRISIQKLTWLLFKREKAVLKLVSKLGNIMEESKPQSRILPQ